MISEPMSIPSEVLMVNPHSLPCVMEVLEQFLLPSARRSSPAFVIAVMVCGLKGISRFDDSWG
jgi:hypothetical protein